MAEGLGGERRTQFRRDAGAENTEAARAWVAVSEGSDLRRAAARGKQHVRTPREGGRAVRQDCDLAQGRGDHHSQRRFGADLAIGKLGDYAGGIVVMLGMAYRSLLGLVAMLAVAVCSVRVGLVEPGVKLG